MSEGITQQESLEFRAEVQQLLNILASSLYTEREIFLRELISNASDALNRMQFILLTNRDVLDPDAELAIRITFDDQARTLSVSDTGVGMTREELIDNLGTIAHSGAMAFLKELEEGQRPSDIIGQFGVGFYSVFMVADEVTVTTRSYRPDSQAWQWTSQGGSAFNLSPAERSGRGTTVTLKLKEDATEYASAWRLEGIVRRHSNYVSFPIYVNDKVANQQTALWRKPQKDVQPGEYDEFYRQLTLDPDPPLAHVHLVTDAPVHLRAILYIPRKPQHGLFDLRTARGPRLYSRKVLIQEHSEDLLPEFLRFVEGVVDSEDIPLNISRETVQSNRVMRQIQKVLVGRVLKALREVADERPDDYQAFWGGFGVLIKQGVVADTGNRDELMSLLRFPSSKADGKLTSLSGYLERMAPDQREIYYILGTDAVTVARSPHLDAFRARGLEVLYMLDPFDGLLVQSVHEHEGKPFQNVDDPSLELPPAPEAGEEDRPEAGEVPADFGPLAERVKAVLGERVTEVRPSTLLTGSPARLVSPNAGYERDLERVRRLLEQDFKVPPKLLELNPHHALVANLARRLAEQPDDPLIDVAVEQLYENLLLLEGLHPNPADMVPRIQKLLEAATK